MRSSSLKILVVEDQASVRGALVQLLCGLGHQAHGAESASQALDMFRSTRPDLILLDVVLPEYDGYWVARQIRSEEGSDWTPIIFLSSRDTDLDLVQGIEAGGDDYLFKPVSSVVLAAKLHAMSRLQRMRRQLMDTSAALHEANERLSNLSMVDDLTQLGNRRRFDEHLHHMVRNCAREQMPLTLMMCDVDLFKQYNDALGHVQGDACLQLIAKCLRSTCHRGTDLAARYGGEEFALILPNTSRSGAMTFARGLQQLLSQQSLPHPQSPFGVVTISGGITTVLPTAQTTAQSLVMRADEALYSAKAKGRNCFFSFEMQQDTQSHWQGIEALSTATAP